MDRRLIFEAVADERRQIANLIDSLDDSQLATPSLCAGWDVKTVAAHLVSVYADSFWVFQFTALRRASLAEAIDELARRRAALPAAEIASDLRQHADHPLSPPLFGPLDPLADILVHGGDIRIPLGLPFKPERQRSASALDFLTRPWRFGFVPLGRLRGISLRATDIDRTWGGGAEVRGPIAALMMSICGRTALLHMLDGPGLPLLRQRLVPDPSVECVARQCIWQLERPEQASIPYLPTSWACGGRRTWVPGSCLPSTTVLPLRCKRIRLHPRRLPARSRQVHDGRRADTGEHV